MARNFSPRSRHTAILLGLVVVSIFFLWGPAAHAIGEGAVSAFFDLSFSGLAKIINGFLYIVLFLVGYAVAALSTALGWIINFRNTASLPIITDLWHIVRDFCNLFFVLIMIVMAFATIFDLSAFGLGGTDFKSLIMKFLIAAVMINFSLAIGQFIVNTINIVNGVFLNALGDISTRFGDVLNPAKVFFFHTDPSGLKSFQDQSWAAEANLGNTFKLLFSNIMGLIILFSMCVAVIFSIIRIPMIWMLLVFSPLAWLASILPRTRSFSNDWWTKFLAWNTFLPIFLFFLYIGMAFLGQQDKILGSLGAGFTGGVLGASGTDTQLVGGVAKAEFLLMIQAVFFYVMAAIILVGGTKIAYESAGGATKWALSTARDLAWQLPIARDYRALSQATSEKTREFQKEGLPGGLKYLYGGQAADEARLQRYRQKLGVKAVSGDNALKSAASEANKRLADLQGDETAGRLTIDAKFADETRGIDRDSTEGIARRSLLYERGITTPHTADDFKKDVAHWAETNPFLAEAMIEKAQKGKFNGISGADLLDLARTAKGKGAFAVRRKLYGSIKESKEARDALNLADISSAVADYGGAESNTGKQFLKDLAEKRPDLVAAFKVSQTNPGLTPGTPRHTVTVANEILKIIEKKKESEIADFDDKTWFSAPGTPRPEFARALKKRVRTLRDGQPGQDAGFFFPIGAPLPVDASGTTLPTTDVLNSSGAVIGKLIDNDDIDKKVLFDPSAAPFLTSKGITPGGGAGGPLEVPRVKLQKLDVQKRAYKANGGDAFKSNLENAVSGKSGRPGIVQSL